MLALHLEGGTSKRVHTEDVTLRCFNLAPDAFSWLKHRGYPDKEVARKDLVRLRDGQYGEMLVDGRAGVTRVEDDGAAISDGWKLTEAGTKWIIANQSRLESQLGVRIAKTTRQEAMKALDRIRKHKSYAEFAQQRGKFVPQLGELAAMLRCRVDAEDRVWASRFASLRNQAQLAGESEILDFLEHCESLRATLA
jgi:hypothetical protein